MTNPIPSVNCTDPAHCIDGNQYRPVPLEAVAFLGAVGVFLVLLLIFALYLNKALCFTNCGGFPCIDRPPKKDSNALVSVENDKLREALLASCISILENSYVHVGTSIGVAKTPSMFTNKVWGLDYSPRKLLSLCCGFLSRSQQNDSSKDDEDEGKAVNGQGPGKAKDDSYDQIPGVNDSANVKSPDSTYGTTENADKPAANGAAYQYDDDTSSDSDDEVLKHYQGLKSTGSVRSSRSGRSKRSAKSGKSAAAQSVRSAKTDRSKRASLDDADGDRASLAEQGLVATKDLSSDEGEQDRHTSHGTESPLVPHSIAGDTTGASEVAGSEAGATSRAGDRVTYENRAFSAELAVSGSLSGSEQGLSAYRLSNDEHLFDVSDLQHEPPLISKCGSLEVTFNFDSAKSKMTITIHKAREIPAKDRGGANNTQVRVMLLPTKKQRFKTKVKEGQDPVYDETFTFSKVTPDEVPGMGLRFRLYGLERMRRERMIGESVIGFASLSLDEPCTHWVILEPRSNLSHGDSGFDVSSLSRSDSASSTQSLQHGGMPELLVGLAYNGTTGRLAVQIIKGSNFRNMAMNRAPDTYVKVTLMSPTGQELQRCKTSVRRGQPNPLFKETFMLQVALFQLPDVTLMVSVYNKKSMKKKEMIGWFSLGQNSSGEEESSHWADMRESKGDEVCRWHVLLES